MEHDVGTTEEFCDCCGISLNKHIDEMGTEECSCDVCEGCGQLIVDVKFEKQIEKNM